MQWNGVCCYRKIMNTTEYFDDHLTTQCRAFYLFVVTFVECPSKDTPDTEDCL